MKPFSKCAFRVSLVCGLLASLVVLTLWLAHKQPLIVVAQWKQPDTITYDGLGPYYLSVFKSDIDWRGFPLNLERRYSIYVGRDSGKPSYGHEIDFTFYPMQSDQADMVTAIKNANAEWHSDGVTLITTSGHRLFIPKSMFIGGR